jgi:hypothetical protein
MFSLQKLSLIKIIYKTVILGLISLKRLGLWVEWNVKEDVKSECQALDLALIG